MAQTPQSLNIGALLTAAPAIYATAQLGTTVRLSQLTVTNVDGINSHQVTIYLCGSSASPTPADFLIVKVLQPNETYIVSSSVGAVLPGGGTVQALCDTINTVNIKISGTVITS